MPRHFDNSALHALKDQLVAEARTLRLERIEQVHAASLRDGAALVIQAAPQDKPKAPGPVNPEAFTNRSPGQIRSHGGRSAKCA